MARQSFQNIEYKKSPFGNYYYGYAGSNAGYKIWKAGRGWYATLARPHPFAKPAFFGDNLADISRQLSAT
jgi:hypothetical protein